MCLFYKILNKATSTTTGVHIAISKKTVNIKHYQNKILKGIEIKFKDILKLSLDKNILTHL